MTTEIYDADDVELITSIRADRLRKFMHKNTLNITNNDLDNDNRDNDEDDA